MSSQLRSLPRLFVVASLAMKFGMGCRIHSQQAAGSFVMDSGEPLTTETAITSTRPLDSGKSFRLGYGYDRMSGERRRSCLDTLKFEPVGRNVRSTDTTFTLVNSKEDLAKVLNIEVNAEASGSYGLVTGSASSKTQIMKNSVFNARTILGIMSFIHRAQEIQIESDYQVLNTDADLLLDEDNESFRLRCGDAYTKSVTTGAAMYITVEVSSRNRDISSNVNTTNSVKAALGEIASASATATVSNETKQTLSNLTMTVSCYSIGITTDACSGSFTSTNAEDVAGIISYLGEAKKAMNASIQSNPNMMVGIDEIFEDYPKPEGKLKVPRDQIFFNYSRQLTVLKNLLEKEIQARSACQIRRTPDCSDIQSLLTDQIKYCARQEFWADCNPSSVNLSTIMANAKSEPIGKLTLWEHINSGKTIVLDFDKNDDAPVRFEPDIVYDLESFRFGRIATSYQSSLSPGWQVRLFEWRNGEGRCLLISGTNSSIQDLKKFNDLALSFRLEKIGDYPQSCEFN